MRWMLGLVAALAGCGPPAPGGLVARSTMPTAPRASYAFRERAVRIAAREIVLEGTLTVPVAADRRPGVVLIHGSGPLGRDEILPGQLGVTFGFEVPVFKELSHHLARAGYVVIRYDKRTCTRDHGCENDYPPDADALFDDIIDDAQSVIDWLRARPEVEPRALYVIGHSLGGSLVPELLTDNPDVLAGVMLAAPYRPIDQISAYQRDYAERLLLKYNVHPLVIGVRIKELAEVADGLHRLRRGTLDDSQIAGAPLAFWQAWIELGEAAPGLVDHLDRPLLAISGDADANVPPSETELWKRKLDSVRPNPGHRAAVVPCVTHALNCIATDARGRKVALRHVAPSLVDGVLRFLQRIP